MAKAKPFIIAFSIIIAVVGALVILVVIDDDGMTPPALPTKSERNKLTLTSNGCCFWVEEVKVWLRDKEDNRNEIAYNDTVYEYDIYRYDIPDFPGSPLQLSVSFRAFYGDECDFSFPVIEIENIDELKKTGVLLYFQEYDDMYINVIAGNYHASYKMGSEKNRWTLMDVPNKVYARD